MATFLLMRSTVALTTGVMAARISSSEWAGTLDRSSSPLSMASATAWGSLPVSIIALPMAHAAPIGRKDVAIMWSTTTLGRGTSISLTPSMPSRRQTARSTVTVVCWSMNRWVSSATWSADWRAWLTSSKFKPSLLSIVLPLISSRDARCAAAWWAPDSAAWCPQRPRPRRSSPPSSCRCRRRSGSSGHSAQAEYRR